MTYDAHIHIALDGADWRAALVRHANGASEQAVRETLAAYAAVGATYLRDGGDKCGASLLAARMAPEYGISFASPGFAMHPAGCYGGFLGRAFASLNEYKRLVDEAAAAGATFVKIMLTGIMDFERFGVLLGGDGLPAAQVNALVEYAHNQGFSVMAHVNGARAVRDALEAGVDSVEHGFYLDAATCHDLAQSGALWVPTFAPVRAQAAAHPSPVIERILALHEENMARVLEEGGLVACGTDAGSGGVPHANSLVNEASLLSSEAHSRALASLRAKFPGA